MSYICSKCWCFCRSMAQNSRDWCNSNKEIQLNKICASFLWGLLDPTTCSTCIYSISRTSILHTWRLFSYSVCSEKQYFEADNKLILSGSYTKHSQFLCNQVIYSSDWLERQWLCVSSDAIRSEWTACWEPNVLLMAGVLLYRRQGLEGSDAADW